MTDSGAADSVVVKEKVEADVREEGTTAVTGARGRSTGEDSLAGHTRAWASMAPRPTPAAGVYPSASAAAAALLVAPSTASPAPARVIPPANPEAAKDAEDPGTPPPAPAPLVGKLRAPVDQGLTLVRFSTQRKRFLRATRVHFRVDVSTFVLNIW